MKVKNGFLLVVLFIGMGSAMAQTSNKKAVPRKAPANEQEIIQEIRELEGSLRTAFMDGKTAWWATHLDEHYSGLNADGKIANKAETIQLNASPDLRYDEMAMSEINASIFNGDCVIATGKSEIKGSYKGQDIGGDYYFMHVWIKEGPDFKLVSASATKLRGSQN